MEKRFIHKSGREVWIALSASLASDTATRTPHLIFQMQDITDRKRAEEQLHHKAFYDVLTGLPNRARFMSDLQMAVERHVLIKDSPNKLFAALFLDLDRFKIINDSLGHLAGDQMLTETARRLEMCVRPGDVVARLGGDEFTILLDELNDINDAILIAERIQNDLKVPFILGGREVFISASIGIALSTAGHNRAAYLRRDADIAM